MKKCFIAVVMVTVLLLNLGSVFAETKEAINETSVDFKASRTLNEEEYLSELAKMKLEKGEINQSFDFKPMYVERLEFKRYDPDKAYRDYYYYEAGSHLAKNNGSGKMIATYQQNRTASFQASWGEAGKISTGVKAKIVEAGVEYSQSSTVAHSISAGTTVGSSYELMPGDSILLTLYYSGTCVDGTITYDVYDWEDYHVGTRTAPSTDVLIDPGNTAIVASQP